MNLQGRHFLKLLDFTPEEIMYLVDLAADLKAKKKKGILTRDYEGQNVALVFEKTSTRTRCSFEVAAHDLGMGSTYLDPSARTYSFCPPWQDAYPLRLAIAQAIVRVPFLCSPKYLIPRIQAQF